MLGAPFDFDFLERFKIPLKRYAAGEKIFLEEDPGDYMYLVVEGKVSIVTYGTVLENVGLHGIFGELALIDSAPRSAAALAAEPSEVALINRDTFLELVRANPAFSLYVMRQLAARIRRMNKSL
jgi:CRP/FNR family cyclic AMP-dependent transcriptional regulator